MPVNFFSSPSLPRPSVDDDFSLPLGASNPEKRTENGSSPPPLCWKSLDCYYCGRFELFAAAFSSAGSRIASCCICLCSRV